MELLAKSFADRSALERRVMALSGLTSEKKSHVIKGTNAELKKLKLSDGKVFWGIPCVASDVKSSKEKERPNRGKIHKTKLESVDIKNSKEV